MAKFRFQDLRIWQLAIEIATELFDIADELERRRLYRFADQLRGSGMSMSNNISEGSGSSSSKEFRRYLGHCTKVHIREREYCHFIGNEKALKQQDYGFFTKSAR